MIAAARTNEWREHPEAHVISTSAEYELGALSSQEIDRVLDVLAANNELGYLTDFDRPQQRHAFEQRAHKQLLVALREATEGDEFDNIVVNEYTKIPSDVAKRAYLYVSALHRFGLITRAAVLHRALDVPLADIGARVFLPAAKIIVPQMVMGDAEPYYRTRHPLIADIVFDRVVLSESERLRFYVTLIRELDLGYASDADTYRRLSRALNRTLLKDFAFDSNKRALMREIQDLDPTDAYVHQHAAMMELALGDLRVAAGHINRAIEERPHDVAIKDTQGRIVLASALRESSQARKMAGFNEAEAIFVKNVTRRPSEPYGYRHLAQTYWERSRAETNSSEKAKYLAATDRVLEEGLDAATDTAMLSQYRAELENQIGNRAEARALLTQALRERPDDLPMRRIAARLAALDSDHGGQIQLLRDGLDMNPDSWELHYELANILAKDEASDPVGVAQHFRAALLAPLRRYRPRLTYAAWLFSQGRYDDAGEQFGKLDAIELPARERLEPRTFSFGALRRRHSGQVVRLAYTNGDVDFDSGATRVFFLRSEVEAPGTVRVGTPVTYLLAFNLRGPIARDLRIRAAPRPRGESAAPGRTGGA